VRKTKTQGGVRGSASKEQVSQSQRRVKFRRFDRTTMVWKLVGREGFEEIRKTREDFGVQQDRNGSEALAEPKVSWGLEDV
jgi:hypothetical protein